jgi:predicted DNA-binding protein
MENKNIVKIVRSFKITKSSAAKLADMSSSTGIPQSRIIEEMIENSYSKNKDKTVRNLLRLD